MPAHGAPRRRGSPVRIAVRLVAYLVIAWGTIATLASGLFPGARLTALAVAVYTTLPLIAFVRWRGWPFYPGRLFRLFVVRPFWYTQLLLPVVAGSGLIGALAGLPFGHALVAGRATAGIMLAVMLLVLALGYLGSKKLVVREVEACVRDLPEEFEGLRIAQLSDLHIGPQTSRHFLARVVDATLALAPDLVAITGDLVDDRAEDVAVFARVLKALDAPMGVYMIAGNHDVYAGWDEVERALRAADAGTVLVNESAVIHRGNATLALVGTGDPAGGKRGSSRAAPDVDRALSGVPATWKSTTVVAFAHNPSLWPSLADRGVSLTLSGHTHWGQFALPWLGWSLASPFLPKHPAMELPHVDHATRCCTSSPGTFFTGHPLPARCVARSDADNPSRRTGSWSRGWRGSRPSPAAPSQVAGGGIRCLRGTILSERPMWPAPPSTGLGCIPPLPRGQSMRRSRTPHRTVLAFGLFVAACGGSDSTGPTFSGPPTAVSLKFCAAAPPLWVGYQNGNGAWTTATAGAQYTYSFTINGGGALAYVSADAGDAADYGYDTEVIFASADELKRYEVAGCVASPPVGTKTIHGVLSGLGVNELGQVSIGSSIASLTGTGADIPFTLRRVADATQDLIAVRRITLSSSGDIARMIVRRGLNLDG